ncbi:hypothetical protein FISHEDRAFT_51883 [Fistulina hepatica ATCC 64428]|nr:hypothetical protein FISHEDRAFT_51883 [Fistulina hepatica ATCC 64428]
MTKHSKNNTASSVFSYAEYRKAGKEYGTRRQRLGNESMRRFDACSLCLNRAREPLACNEGHLFCKECVYTDLLTQKKDIKRQKDRLKTMEREAEEERVRARQAARERVLLEFEKGQLGLAAAASATSTSSGASSTGRGTKRKFSFDKSAMETLAQEAEEAALRQIEREQAEALKSKLPDFWLPSLTPTYTTNGPPRSLKDVKLQTTCRGGNPLHSISLKNLSPVNFTMLDSKKGPADADASTKKDEASAMCPSCKKALSNNTISFQPITPSVMRSCGHVVCKTCTDALVRPAGQCVVCDDVLKDGDIIEMKREGTGFASGGLAETVKAGTAFQA